MTRSLFFIVVGALSVWVVVAVLNLIGVIH